MKIVGLQTNHYWLIVEGLKMIFARCHLRIKWHFLTLTQSGICACDLIGNAPWECTMIGLFFLAWSIWFLLWALLHCLGNENVHRNSDWITAENLANVNLSIRICNLPLERSHDHSTLASYTRVNVRCDINFSRSLHTIQTWFQLVFSSHRIKKDQNWIYKCT